VADKLAATEVLFKRHLDSDVPFIHKAGAYISQGGGKRVRPPSSFSPPACSATTGTRRSPTAAVVEFIHTATLIHDDIIDHAALRRGQTTLNHLWGNNLTVLLGELDLHHGDADGPFPRPPGGGAAAVRGDAADDRGGASRPSSGWGRST